MNAARAEQVLGEVYVGLAQPQLDDVAHVLVRHVQVSLDGAGSNESGFIKNGYFTSNMTY